MLRIGSSVAWMVVACLMASPVCAEGRGDGLYGRLDGDLALSASAGGAWSPRLADARGVLVEGRARYLDVVGLVFCGVVGSRSESQEFLGLELRPLFPALFATNRFSGSRRLDLTLQSIGVEVGVVATPLQGGGIGGGVGYGAGIETPLLLFHDTTGLWVRFSGRYVRAHAHRTGPDISGSILSDRSFVGVSLLLRDVWSVGLARAASSSNRAALLSESSRNDPLRVRVAP